MPNLAIVVGNSDYQNLQKLDCCRVDVQAIKKLLESTEKYDEITIIENTDADALKSQLRSTIDKVQKPSELFFYFTGHGYQLETEFFFCSTNFEAKRPNDTGISTTELHTILRLAGATLVVKVVDACNSGTLLVKSDAGWISQNKDGFNNLIQISSCLDCQNSLTGNPLSLFTEKFRSAALRKTEGVVFYTDIVSTLRDEFIDNVSQTPFFVSQHTGREQFVDDAKRLDDLRMLLYADRGTETVGGIVDQQLTAPQVRTLLERLRAADALVVKPEAMSDFVEGFFDCLLQKMSAAETSDFFDMEVVEHARFEEDAAENFIISVMEREKRPDNFVTATHTRKRRNPNPNSMLITGAFDRFLADDAFIEEWNLSLNCSMKRAQIKVTLTPKFVNLRRIVLIVSCAPSLDNCYIFENSTLHLLRDFGKFDSYGEEISRRWWKPSWSTSTEGIVNQISEKLADTVREQLEVAETRLAK